MKYGRQRRELVMYSGLLYDRGYMTALEGNVSLRVGQDLFLITPSRLLKKNLGKDDLVLIDGNGNKIKGRYNASSETSTHLEIYRQNPDVDSIVHAHPFYTLLCTVTGLKPFEKICLAEVPMFLKNPVFAPYARPSSDEGAEAARKYSKNTKVLVIEHHGSFTYGKDLFEAFSLVEMLEKYCRLFYFASLSGKEIKCLDDTKIKRLGG